MQAGEGIIVNSEKSTYVVSYKEKEGLQQLDVSQNTPSSTAHEGVGWMRQKRPRL